MLCGIVFIIVRRKTRRLKSQQIINSYNTSKHIESLGKDSNEKEKRILTQSIFANQIELQWKKYKQRQKRNKYLWILVLVLIYMIPMFLDSYVSLNEDLSFGTSSSLSLFFCIFSTIIFSRLILGNKIYYHQIFSSIIIICFI